MHDCYIFSPCTLKTCDFKWLDWLDRWSQYWQAYAFSPVCTLKCLLMFFVMTFLKQIEHLDLPTSNGKLSWNNHDLKEKLTRIAIFQSNTAYWLKNSFKMSINFFIQLIIIHDCLCIIVYIFSPCTLKTCDFKLLDWLDRWLQYGQANGFSPVCTLKWLLMFFFLTILKQIEHFDLPTSNGE